jgi:ATP-dependent helicase/nuclease subunit B
MSVQFHIGRFGSGKTTVLMDRTIAACKADPLGPPIVWLVPRQATFQLERNLCCGPKLNGFFRVRVAHFDLFCRHVLEETGGCPAAEIDSIGRQMILGHLLRKQQHQLQFFRSAGAPGGLAAELDATLTELSSAGVEIAALSANLSPAANSALAAKIADLLCLQTAYAAFLGENRLDPDARLARALESLEQCASVRTATVFVDSFTHFTARERRLLVALGRLCRNLHIALCFDPDSEVLENVHHLPDDLSVFHGMEMEYRKLHFDFAKAGIKILPPNLLKTAPRFQTPALRKIESWFAGTSADSPEGLELIEAPDKRAEADAIARRVRDLAASGMRYRDIVVLARSLGDYHDLISAAFAEHGIPCFLDQRRPAAHHPLIQFLRAVVALAAGDWPADAMTALLKSGLTDLNPAEGDELENYCILHGIQGDTWSDEKPWIGIGTAREETDRDEDDRAAPTPSASADLLRRRLVDPIRPLISAVSGGDKTVRQICTAMFDLIERFPLRKAMARLIESSATLEQAAEHKQVWAESIALFDRLVDLLGDQVMPLPDFTALLESSLEKLDLAIPPQTVDQVLVGEVERTRPPAVKAAVIVGLSDRQFPLTPPPEKVLTDADRLTLAETISDIEPDRRRRALDEVFLGQFAFTRPSRLLIATRPLADGRGAKLAPGSLWQKLRDLVPSAPVVTASSPDQLAAKDVATPRQLVTGLMCWARNGGKTDLEIWPALYQWLAQRDRRGDAVDSLRALAWPALTYKNDASIPDDLARRLFAAPLRASARQLETFRACPFQHFARYGLNLAQRREHGVNHQDVSNVFHDVMDAVIRRMVARREKWADLANIDLSELVQNAGLRLKGEWMLSSARNQFLLQWMGRTLKQVIAAQSAVGQRGGFLPNAVGVHYNQSGDLPPLRIVTPAGNELLVHGRIDRVDIKSDNRAAVVYDYRLRASTLSLQNVYYGLALKLMTDLLAWQQTRPSRPVAGLHAALMRPIEEPDDVRAAPSPGEEMFDLRVPPRGIIDDHFALDLDRRLQPGAPSDVFHIRVNKDANFRKNSDIAQSAELAGLLDHVKTELAAIADEILEGIVSVRPYRIGTESPCAHCDYKSVCRFDPDEGYNWLDKMGRQEVLDEVRRK